MTPKIHSIDTKPENLVSHFQEIFDKLAIPFNIKLTSADRRVTYIFKYFFHAPYCTTICLFLSLINRIKSLSILQKEIQTDSFVCIQCIAKRLTCYIKFS